MGHWKLMSNKKVDKDFRFSKIFQRWRDEAMKKRGITLLELIIIMAIIAFGSVLMVPNIGAWLPAYRLKSAARDVVSTMRVAQMKAVASNVQYRVSFDDAAKTYILQRQTGGLFVDDGISQALPSGISINSISFLGNKYVTFNPNSTAVSGSIVLQNPKGTQKTITVLSTTGRVNVSPP